MPDDENNTIPKITWSKKDPYVKRCLSYIRRKKEVTAEDIVKWDERNEKRLFSWDDEEAAKLQRLAEASRFLNSFVRKVESYRVKLLTGLPTPEQPRKKVYVQTSTVHDLPGVAEMIQDRLIRKMESIAQELQFWKLPEEKRRNLLNTLDTLMTGEWKE